MPTGTVKYYMPRQYGVIRPDDKSATDVFVHERTLLQSGVSNLEEGDTVEYAAELDTKGRLAATFIKKLP